MMFVSRCSMKSFLKISGLFLMLTFSMSSWALTINSTATDVGGYDSIIASVTQGTPDLLNSGDATVLAWVESELGFSVTFDSKNDGVFDWNLVDGTINSWAHSLSTDPEYFLIKIGNGGLFDSNGDAAQSHYLFENSDSLSYGVMNFDLFDLYDMNNNVVTIDQMRVSHISEFNATIPEPGTLALFGLGLLGLVVASRRKS